MNQLDKIVYKIADLLNRQYDIPLIRSLEDSAWNLRAMFIRREYDKTSTLHDVMVQDLGCIPLILVDAAECCSVEVGCKVKRTEFNLPKPIRLKEGKPFAYVGSVDGYPEFILSTEFEIQNQIHAEYPTPFPNYLYKNGHIYVFGTTERYLRVRGVFARPSDAEEFKGCKDSHCDTDFEAYIPEDMAELIEQELLKKYAVPTQDNKDEVKV